MAKTKVAKIRPDVRPDITTGITRKIETGCGHFYVTINVDATGKMFEVFGRLGKAGGCAAAQTETTCRLISLALRSGIAPKAVAMQLKGISCHVSIKGKNPVSSCSDALAIVMLDWLKKKKKE